MGHPFLKLPRHGWRHIGSGEKLARPNGCIPVIIQIYLSLPESMIILFASFSVPTLPALLLFHSIIVIIRECFPKRRIFIKFKSWLIILVPGHLFSVWCRNCFSYQVSFISTAVPYGQHTLLDNGVHHLESFLVLELEIRISKHCRALAVSASFHRACLKK